jgi:hypothetical protein
MRCRTRSETAAVAATDAAAAASARVEARRFNFISCLILTAQNGFGRDVDPFVALCRETWGEEILFDALKDLPHGRARREGPAVQGATEPFGFDHGPFSARRTRVMYAAQAGDVARLRWLIARGEKKTCLPPYPQWSPTGHWHVYCSSSGCHQQVAATGRVGVSLGRPLKDAPFRSPPLCEQALPFCLCRGGGH